MENVAGSAGSSSKGDKSIILAVALPLLFALILLGLGVGLILYKQRRREDPVVTTRGRFSGHNNKNDNNNQSHHEDFELPLLDLLTLVNATDNFSIANNIGERYLCFVYSTVILHCQGN
ncbi:uncharacterized protein [Solanum tuberosum]|uniref:uncharacterized protein n=1 Tax=Solanum tuberosum TaxID=4113 RepID=UPI00073A0A18|nr:PREDICTED: uncharacterized protein LOC102580523 [Solanum tuberosum]